MFFYPFLFPSFFSFLFFIFLNQVLKTPISIPRISAFSFQLNCKKCHTGNRFLYSWELITIFCLHSISFVSHLIDPLHHTNQKEVRSVYCKVGLFWIFFFFFNAKWVLSSSPNLTYQVARQIPNHIKILETSLGIYRYKRSAGEGIGDLDLFIISSSCC